MAIVSGRRKRKSKSKDTLMSKHAVIVVKDELRQKVYTLNTPNVGESDFYRQTVSLNAFFYSVKGRNISPSDILYVCEMWSEFEQRQERHAKHGIEYEMTDVFDSIWDFYKFIGYDYKKKKYAR